MTAADRRAYLLGLDPAARRAALNAMSPRQRRALRTHWQLWAHAGQLAPKERDWMIWLILAGRGFGKTRAGAEWVRAIAESDPSARIALVGATLAEARSVMVEGDSGLLAIAPRGSRPLFEPSRRQLSWPSGAQAMLYSAGEAESLRGPQHSHGCRTGAEGSVRQRGPCARRCSAALRDRGRGVGAAGESGGWRVLAGRRFAHRRLGRSGGTAGLPAGRELADRDAARRHARIRSQHRAGASFSGRLENSRGGRGTNRRIDR